MNRLLYLQTALRLSCVSQAPAEVGTDHLCSFRPCGCRLVE